MTRCCNCLRDSLVLVRSPYKQAVSVLLGQRWTEREARELHDLIAIGASPPRDQPGGMSGAGKLGKVDKPVLADDAIAALVVTMRANGAAVHRIQAELGLGRDRVERILARSPLGLSKTALDADRFNAIAGSIRLAQALREHHPERCGVQA